MEFREEEYQLWLENQKMDKDFLALMGEKTDEELRMIYQDYAGMEGLEGQNIADANAVLQGPQSTGQTVGPGNFYVANAGGAIADAIRNFSAGGDRRDAKAALAGYSADKTAGTMDTARTRGEAAMMSQGLRGGGMQGATDPSILTPEELERRRRASTTSNAYSA
jgi:hypothetical protein